jgi:hypothetical protein
LSFTHYVSPAVDVIRPDLAMWKWFARMPNTPYRKFMGNASIPWSFESICARPPYRGSTYPGNPVRVCRDAVRLNA